MSHCSPPSTMATGSPSCRPGLVSFVGAGPGDPELLTLKGRRAIAEAALVLYAGSLVPAEVVACAARDAEVRDSSPLTLAQCHALVRRVALSGRPVARVHTGDPTLYGTLREQTRLLDADGIPWRVIPGVTAACAAAAAAGISLTLPEQRQTCCITRLDGRTRVPSAESLAALAATGAALAIYLSASLADRLQEVLCQVLPPQTCVLCASRVGWPDARLVTTTLENLADTVRYHGMERQTVFLILPGEDAISPPSCLYDADFAHAFRQVR